MDAMQYWLVHGDGPTNYRHASRAEAVIEAERLARRHPGQIFVVLEAVEAVRKVDVERVNLLRPGVHPSRDRSATADDIPF